MVQLSFNEFVNLKINPEQAVQDWNAEQEATNKSISSHNHSPLANGPLKDMWQQWDFSRSSRQKNRSAMVTLLYWYALSGFPAPTSSLVSSRAENTFLSSINCQYSFQGHIIVSCQTPPTGNFPACNKTDICAGTGEIWATRGAKGNHHSN